MGKKIINNRITILSNAYTVSTAVLATNNSFEAFLKCVVDFDTPNPIEFIVQKIGFASSGMGEDGKPVYSRYVSPNPLVIVRHEKKRDYEAMKRRVDEVMAVTEIKDTVCGMLDEALNRSLDLRTKIARKPTGIIVPEIKRPTKEQLRALWEKTRKH